VIAVQIAVAVGARAGHWTLWVVPWWGWLVGVVPETALLVALVDDRVRGALDRIGHRDTAEFVLFGIVSATNALLLVALIASLLNGQEHHGGQLLAKGLCVWSADAVTFGLWFWAIDRGGPRRRLEPDPPPPDFEFPQVADPSIGEPGWYPRVFDYLYVAFTNSIAFSPTDTLPLTRRAKALMLAESAVSAVTVLLIAARAVNILD